MVAKVELGKITKYAMIGLGALLFISWILLVVGCAREGVMISDILHKVEIKNKLGMKFEENTMVPSVFAPFFVTIACLLFAFVSIYFILFPIAILSTISIGLSIWCIVRNADCLAEFEKIVEEGPNAIELLRQRGFDVELLKELFNMMKDSKPIYIFNLVVLGINIFLCVVALLFAVFFIFKYISRSRGGRDDAGQGVGDSNKRGSKSRGTQSSTGSAAQK